MASQRCLVKTQQMNPAMSNNRGRLCAWLHIVSGVCILVVMSLVLAYVASSYSTSSLPEGIKSVLGSAGIAIGTALSVIAGAELIGGVAYLSARPLGKPLLLLSSALQLVNLPFGTALGLYTFWEFFRVRTVHVDIDGDVQPAPEQLTGTAPASAPAPPR